MSTWLAILIGFGLLAAANVVVGLVTNIALERYIRGWDFQLEQLTEAAWHGARHVERIDENTRPAKKRRRRP